METFKVCKKCGRELPEESFKLTRWGKRVSVCTECATKVRRENKDKKKKDAELKKVLTENMERDKKKQLESFTPRELMNELADRGYKGKLTYTQVIDITNF